MGQGAWLPARLDTAARHGLGILVIISNNGAWAIEATSMEMFRQGFPGPFRARQTGYGPPRRGPVTAQRTPGRAPRAHRYLCGPVTYQPAGLERQGRLEPEALQASAALGPGRTGRNPRARPAEPEPANRPPRPPHHPGRPLPVRLPTLQTPQPAPACHTTPGLPPPREKPALSPHRDSWEPWSDFWVWFLQALGLARVDEGMDAPRLRFNSRVNRLPTGPWTHRNQTSTRPTSTASAHASTSLTSGR